MSTLYRIISMPQVLTVTNSIIIQAGGEVNDTKLNAWLSHKSLQSHPQRHSIQILHVPCNRDVLPIFTFYVKLVWPRLRDQIWKFTTT